MGFKKPTGKVRKFNLFLNIMSKKNPLLEENQYGFPIR